MKKPIVAVAAALLASQAAPAREANGRTGRWTRQWDRSRPPRPIIARASTASASSPRGRAEGRADHLAAAWLPFLVARIRYAASAARHALSSHCAGFSGLRPERGAPALQYTVHLLSSGGDDRSLLTQLGVTKCAFFIHDYGGPIGFRIFLDHPERVQALIVSNANAYTEAGSGPNAIYIANYWTDRPGHPEIFNTFVSARRRGKASHARHPASRAVQSRYMDRRVRVSVEAWLARASRPTCSMTTAQRRCLSGLAGMVARALPPTLVVWGRTIPPSSGLAARFSNAMCRMPKSTCSTPGHFCAGRENDEIAALILQFLPRQGHPPNSADA